jgi:hypothetical protein
MSVSRCPHRWWHHKRRCPLAGNRCQHTPSSPARTTVVIKSLHQQTATPTIASTGPKTAKPTPRTSISFALSTTIFNTKAAGPTRSSMPTPCTSNHPMAAPSASENAEHRDKCGCESAAFDEKRQRFGEASGVLLQADGVQLGRGLSRGGFGVDEMGHRQPSQGMKDEGHGV